MIYVRRDTALIPKGILATAVAAQKKLEKIKTPKARRTYIKAHSKVWRNFSSCLAKMSYGKCWYSESPDPQSFFDVDHFRPKLAAKRSKTDTDKPGYEWLAFSWENFRYAANCSNRSIRNIETGVVDGKGNWFPVLAGSVKAHWDDRCEAKEKAVLLDPVVRGDVRLLDVAADGQVVPSKYAIGRNKERVTRSCQIYGLNLPGIRAARLRLMREIDELISNVGKTIDAANAPVMPPEAADLLPLEGQIEVLRKKTEPGSPYARTARAALSRAGYGDLCSKAEEAA